MKRHPHKAHKHLVGHRLVSCSKRGNARRKRSKRGRRR